MPTQDARRAGLSRRDLALERQGGRRIVPGLYSETQEPWLRYEERCRGALARLQGGAALAGPSAAALMKIPLLSVPAKVYVRNIPRGTYGAHLAVLPPGPVADFGDIPVTEPARVAADCARILGSPDALIVADALLAGGLCTAEALHETARALRGTTGVQRVRWVAENADGKAESPGETWTRMTFRNLGYDVVSQQHVVMQNREAWLDLLIEGTRIGVEFDGKAKYVTYGPTKVVQEKMREGDLEAQGYRLLHVVWGQLRHPTQLDRRARQAGARPVRRSVSLPW